MNKNSSTMTTTMMMTLMVIMMIGSVSSSSDMFGQNPQHDVANVFAHSEQPLIPFWTVEGDAFANDKFIRLVPDRQSKRGAIWNTSPLNFGQWEAVFRARIHGVSPIGADGMAFWLTDEPAVSGDFFGYKETFRGIGVVIDTYDNDNTGMHPVAMVLLNDGTKHYEHKHKRESKEVVTIHPGAAIPMEIGYCHLNLRNKPNTFLLRVTYQNSILRVTTDLTGKGDSFEDCVVAENVFVPTGYYFGFTAATGQLADNHDLHGFSVRNLDPNAFAIDSQRTHSQFDKYDISESLSRMNFQMESLLRKDSSTCGTVGPSEGSTSSSVSADISSLKSSVHSIDQTVNRIAGNLVGIDSKVSNIQNLGGNSPVLSREISDLKSSLSTISHKLSQVSSELRRDESSDSSWLWIFFILSLIAVAILSAALYKKHTETNKRLF